MATPELLNRIRSLVRRGWYRLSLHAENERDAEGITIEELAHALLSEQLDLLEDYPNDPRGHSHLLLGFTERDRPIHVVCAIHENMLVVVTVYRPDPRLWQNHRVRRKGKG